MNSQRWLTILFLSMFFYMNETAVAQDDGQRKIPFQLSVISDIDIDMKQGNPISFSPGLMFDVGLRVMNKEKDKARGTLTREFYVKPFLGFYKRADYHTALMIGTDLTYRATRPTGIFWDFNIGTGYMHLFYNTPVYEYVDGGFERKRFQGYSNVVVKGAVNVGYDFGHNNSALPLGVFVGGGMFFRYPNNASWPFHPYVQLGLMYTLKKDKK